MFEGIVQHLYGIGDQIYSLFITASFSQILMHYMPFVIVIELPYQIFIILGILKYHYHEKINVPYHTQYYPMVSVIITCYAEGDDVAKSILSTAEQLYPGRVEIIAMVDGASANIKTYRAAKALQSIIEQYPNRSLRVIPKWKRGGRVSALNTALHFVHGEIIMALDGDSSCDNDLLIHAIRAFADPNVMGVAGAIRVRNLNKNLLTHLQGIEYLLAIHATKVALTQFNAINIIPGALGLFRRKFIVKLMGWDSGSSEDLDLTLRMQAYFGRHPNLKIHFEPKAVIHTDAPESFYAFFLQRFRWDGDLFYIYIRKHWRSFDHKILGWKNLLFAIWSGLIFQLFLPLAIVVYCTYIALIYRVEVVLGLLFMIYVYYLVIEIILFVEFLCFISERKKQDLRLIPYLFVLPIYAFSSRLWGGIASLSEIFLRTHQDSSMAPWWVLKKSKF